jgi:hypothetical protein
MANNTSRPFNGLFQFVFGLLQRVNHQAADGQQAQRPRDNQQQPPRPFCVPRCRWNDVDYGAVVHGLMPWGFVNLCILPEVPADGQKRGSAY